MWVLVGRCVIAGTVYLIGFVEADSLEMIPLYIWALVNMWNDLGVD